MTAFVKKRAMDARMPGRLLFRYSPYHLNHPVIITLFNFVLPLFVSSPFAVFSSFSIPIDWQAARRKKR
jgi:hypothetical protein